MMKFEIKTKMVGDKRRRTVVETTNRMDVVKAIGGKFSPKDAEEMIGKGFLALRKGIQIKVTMEA